MSPQNELMIRPIIAAGILSLTLSACTISKAPSETTPSTSEAPKTQELDKTQARLAEVTVPMAELGKTLRKIGTFDAHMEWNNEFITQTITEASLLKENDRMEGPMLAKVGDLSAEIQVVIIRVGEDKYAVRAVTSEQPIAEAIDKAIKQ